MLGRAKGDVKAKIAAEGARTVPPREHGGNCDIKDLSRGSKIYFPVYVKGAGLSMGDLHFSQGDGEITFCGAIEMAGWLHLKVDVIKGGMAKYGIKNPIFKPSPIVPTYNDYLIFEGISVDEQGKQYYLDVHIAYRQACLNAIEYLTKFGYSRAQAYAILGTAPCQGHISRRRRHPQRLRDACGCPPTSSISTSCRAPPVRPSSCWAGSRCRCLRTSDQASRQGATDAGLRLSLRRCGAFTAMRPMAECEQPNPCPGCGRAAERAFLHRALFFGDAGGTAQGARDQREERACAVVAGSDESSGTAQVAHAAAGSPCATASGARTAPRAFRPLGPG